MTEFLNASTWQRAPSDPTRFTTTIDPRWGQGKGAYGGLLSAGILRAMIAVVDDARRAPRTLHVHYCAPAKPGALEVDVIVERMGATMTTLSARARQQGNVVTLATATFAVPSAKPDARAKWRDALMPAAPDVGTVEALPPEVAFLPLFTQFFEYRFCIGDAMFSGAEAARAGGWVRLREPSTVDAPMIAALIDTYPPAVLPRLEGPRPSASVNLTVDFHAAPSSLVALAPDTQFLLSGTSRVGDGGTTDEAQDLWSADGGLLASCRQLVVLL